MDFLVRRALTGALAVVVLLPAAAAAQQPDPEKPLFDSRDREPVPPAAPEDPDAIRARDRLSARLGRQGVVQVDARTGTPRFVGRLDGWLTGPSGADPERIAIDYIRAQRGVFGLTDADLAGLRLVRRYSDSAGTTYLEWAQTWRGITVFDNGVQAAVAGDGRLINVSGSPLPDPAARSSAPGIGAAAALANALDDAGSRGLAPRASAPAGPDQTTTFSGGHDARLVLFADRAGDVHLAWRVTANAGPGEVYDDVIDADTGDLLFRENTVDHLGATVHAFASNPGHGTQDGRPVAVEDDTKLAGPNARVYADLNSNDVIDAPDEEIPASAPATWNYPFVEKCSPAALCSWRNGVASSWSENKNRSGAQLYYLVNTFHDWLAKPPFDFTAASGAFEGDDRLIAETLDGANGPGGLPDDKHDDNAFMNTPKNGQSPRMSMFLWRGAQRDSSDDASVVFHEYTHGLSNRLITDSAGKGALASLQSKAMGEGWSDWYALDYLVQHGHETDTAAPGELRVATYVNGPNGIRSEPTDCPVGPGTLACPGNPGGGPGGYTYGDFGRVGAATSEHPNGEIWGQTLWDLRGAIGPDAARQVVTTGMRLSPDNPSMLDMRNAILQADVDKFGGANRTKLWQVFAGRGMGFFASTRNDATRPRESFDAAPPPGGGVAISGLVTDRDTGAPVPSALIDFRGVPGDTTGTTGADGRYAIASMLPGTYSQAVVSAPGYDTRVDADVVVGPGGIVDFQLRRDFAAGTGGAKVVGFGGPDFSADGCGPNGLIDTRLGTGWGSTSHNFASAPGAKSISIALPTAVDISAIGIDPGAICGDGDSASTGAYRLETSADGSAFTEAATGAFTTANNHRINEVAPTAGAGGVRFVRFTMLNPQRQAGAKDSPSIVSGRDYMDAAELTVYGAPTRTPAPPPSTPSTPTVPLAPIDRKAPDLTLRFTRRQRLAAVLARGLKLAARCDERCSMQLTAQLDAKTAKRLGLLSRRSRAKFVTVATGSLPLGDGSRNATLRFTAKAKRRLRGQRILKLSISAAVQDASGNTANPTSQFELRR